MKEQNLNYLLQFFKAAGQPDRLKILGLLANQPQTANELAKNLQLKQKTVSKHLQILRAAKLITKEAADKKPRYQLDQSKLEAINQMIENSTSPPSLKEVTINKYIVDNRLTAIPQKSVERKIILEWLTNKFEENRRYTETEITELIRIYYDQPLSLRRILADNRFLLHTGRHYWRPIPGRVV